MSRPVRRLPVVVAALIGLAAAGSAGEVTLTPSFSALQGFSDNVNALPDDAPPTSLRHESAFVQLRPGARIALREGAQAALGLSYAAEYEKYDAAIEGDAVSHVAGVDARLGGPADGLRLTASGGFTGRELLNVRSAAGLPYLNSRAWRGGGGVEIRVLKKSRLAVFTNYSLVSRSYPRYLAPTDPTTPGVMGEREDGLQTLTFGATARPLDALSLQVAALGTQNDGNIYALQQGTWRDYFSFRGKGALLTLTGAPARTLVCSVSGSYLRRESTERLVTSTGEQEASTSLSASASVFWFVSRGAGLSIEFQHFRNDSNAPRASFANNRLLAGVRLSEDLKLF